MAIAGEDGFLREAPRLSTSLDELEHHLREVWERLVENQLQEEVLHKVGDLLWSPRAGWGVALSEARAVRGGKLAAYLHLRAHETRVVAAGFYLNVSKAADTEASVFSCLFPVVGDEEPNG